MSADLLSLQKLLPPVILCLAAVAGLVLSDYRHRRAGRYLCKPLAAVAFLWLALSHGLPASAYGAWMVLGLLCCMAGDLLLMPDSKRGFLAGLCAFLCGHLLFAAAFLQMPHNLSGLVLSSPPALALLVAATLWLAPHLGRDMQVPVILYILVITGMLLCAGLTAGQPAAPLIIGGAWCFAISDLAVARRQFVQDSRYNGLWGTPLYFLAQMLLAYSVLLA